MLKGDIFPQSQFQFLLIKYKWFGLHGEIDL